MFGNFSLEPLNPLKGTYTAIITTLLLKYYKTTFEIKLKTAAIRNPKS